MTIVQGDPQSAVIGAAFATALTVKVADSFGNPYSGVDVTFVPSGAAATATFTGVVTVATNGRRARRRAHAHRQQSGGLLHRRQRVPLRPC